MERRIGEIQKKKLQTEEKQPIDQEGIKIWKRKRGREYGREGITMYRIRAMRCFAAQFSAEFDKQQGKQYEYDHWNVRD